MKTKKSWRRSGWVRAALWAGLAGLGTAALVLALRVWVWPLELFSHFVPHSLVASGIAATVALATRNRVAAVLGAVLAAFFAAVLWHAYGPTRATLLVSDRPPNATTSPTFTVITHNVLDRNPRQQELHDWLKARPADVVLLQEVPTPLAQDLRRNHTYPFQFYVFDRTLRTDAIYPAHAITLLSRYPILETTKLKPADDLRPAALVRVAVPGAEDPWIIVVDCLQPITRSLLDGRDRYLRGIATAVAALDGPVIVAGDFNATRFTASFQDFARVARIQPIGGYAPTWPTWLGWLGLPIDHVLLRSIDFVQSEVLAAIGSDHRPIRVALRLPGAPS